jgi:predicted kinase
VQVCQHGEAMGAGDQHLDVGELADGSGSRVHRPLLMLVSGLPGVGKSVLVAELAPRVGAVILSRDGARLGLDSGRLTRLVESLVWRLARRRLAGTQRRAGRVLERSVGMQLESNRSVIVEAVAEDALRERLHAMAVAHGAAFVQVECVLSDRAEHHRRLGMRAEGERFWRGVVGGIRNGYQPPAECLRIDTTAAPDQAVERILALVRLD